MPRVQPKEPQNHPTAHIGRDLERSPGATSPGKGSVDETTSCPVPPHLGNLHWWRQPTSPDKDHSPCKELLFLLFLTSIDRHFTVLSYRMHGVQDLGELVKPPRAGRRVLPLASNDTVKFLDVIHSKFIKELLVLQAIHWNWNTVKKQQGLPRERREHKSKRKAEEEVSADPRRKFCPPAVGL